MIADWERFIAGLSSIPSINYLALNASDDDLEQLRRLLAERPDMTLGELATALGRRASESTLCRTLQRLGLPRKKSPSVPRSGTART